MTNAGNIVGYGFGLSIQSAASHRCSMASYPGFLPLAQLPIIRLLGGTQFRKFCVICIIILVTTVWMTCFFHEEQARPKVYGRNKRWAIVYNPSSTAPDVILSKLKDVAINIRTAIVNLPKPVRRVCYVQLFAFMGWYVCFLFVPILY